MIVFLKVLTDWPLCCRISRISVFTMTYDLTLYILTF
jgi:hypothetical protein